MNSIIQMDSDLNHTYTGFGFFDIYNKNSFKQPARTTWIDGWKIEYMAIADPKTIYNTPIVIVGGAFQNFNSYKYCVEQLFESGPVILIDLPSMGANQQIRNVDTGESAGMVPLTSKTLFSNPRLKDNIGFSALATVSTRFNNWQKGISCSNWMFASPFPEGCGVMDSLRALPLTLKAFCSAA